MNGNPNELEISRRLAAPRARICQAWSDPKLLAQWWCPRPWTTEVRAFDFRAGGDFCTFMRSPDGGESDNPGCFLEVAPQERIVMTSLLTGGWRPATPWLALTAIITMADEDAGTRFIARVLLKDSAGSTRHKEMCLQLEELAQKIT